MKKSQILRAIITVLFSLLLIQIISNIYIVSSDILFGTGILRLGIMGDTEPTLLLKIMVILKIISVIFLIIGVFLIIRTLKYTKLKEYFRLESYKSFRDAGIFLSISGIIALLIVLQNFVSLRIEPMIYLDSFNLKPHLFTLILGLFFIFFSKILKQGVVIKNENDLTI